MKIIRVQDQLEGGKVAFSLLKESLAEGATTLGLATGSTPITFYQELVNSDLDCSALTSINLDEYVGLPVENDQSYDYFMRDQLFNAKPFKESFLPNGLADDLEAEVKRYDQVIAEHPIDFQILGIGRNGHIGFNEPGTSLQKRRMWWICRLRQLRLIVASLLVLMMCQSRLFQWELLLSWHQK